MAALSTDDNAETTEMQVNDDLNFKANHDGHGMDCALHITNPYHGKTNSTQYSCLTWSEGLNRVHTNLTEGRARG